MGAPNFWAYPDTEHERSPEISNSHDTLPVRPCHAPPAKFRMATIPSLPDGLKPQTAPVRVGPRPAALAHFAPFLPKGRGVLAETLAF